MLFQVFVKGGYLCKHSRRQACSYVVAGRVGEAEKARLTRKNPKRGVVVDAAVRRSNATTTG